MFQINGNLDLSIRTCTLCPYETRFKHNLNRHTAKAHTAKEKEPKATKACPECGKPFPTQKKLTRHKKIHQTKDSPTSPKVVQKVKSNIWFGTSKCIPLMLLKISVHLIWIIFVSFAKYTPELATPAKSVHLS